MNAPYMFKREDNSMRIVRTLMCTGMSQTDNVLKRKASVPRTLARTILILTTILSPTVFGAQEESTLLVENYPDDTLGQVLLKSMGHPTTPPQKSCYLNYQDDIIEVLYHKMHENFGIEPNKYKSADTLIKEIETDKPIKYKMLQQFITWTMNWYDRDIQKFVTENLECTLEESFKKHFEHHNSFTNGKIHVVLANLKCVQEHCNTIAIEEIQFVNELVRECKELIDGKSQEGKKTSLQRVFKYIKAKCRSMRRKTFFPTSKFIKKRFCKAFDCKEHHDKNLAKNDDEVSKKGMSQTQDDKDNVIEAIWDEYDPKVDPELVNKYAKELLEIKIDLKKVLSEVKSSRLARNKHRREKLQRLLKASASACAEDLFASSSETDSDDHPESNATKSSSLNAETETDTSSCGSIRTLESIREDMSYNSDDTILTLPAECAIAAQFEFPSLTHEERKAIAVHLGVTIPEDDSISEC